MRFFGENRDFRPSRIRQNAVERQLYDCPRTGWLRIDDAFSLLRITDASPTDSDSARRNSVMFCESGTG